jgi:hypothetical protein
MAASGWPKSDDTLRRVLQALQSKGWIEFDVRQGQRRPYGIRLTGLLCRRNETRLPHDLRKIDPEFAEVTSAHGDAATSAGNGAMRDPDSRRPPHDLSAPSTSLSTKEDHLVGEATGEPLSFECLDPEVQKFAARGRAQRESALADADFDFLGTAGLDRIAHDLGEDDAAQ